MSRSSSTVLLLFLALLPGLGCSADRAWSLNQAAEFSAAYATWKSLPREHYAVEVRISCFCPAGQWAHLEVRHDSVVALVLVSGDSVPREEWRSWPTVDGIFSILRDAYASDQYASISARFDRAAGFPTRAALSLPRSAVDGNLTVEARHYLPMAR
ncbi:MAG: DUF6174 domain-containing protein [Gemmatimonadales bacterium]